MNNTDGTPSAGTWLQRNGDLAALLVAVGTLFLTALGLFIGLNYNAAVPSGARS